METTFDQHYVPVIALAGTIAVNGIVGGRVGEVANADAQRLTFLPANWTFSIWGVIYAAMAYVCIDQMTSKSWSTLGVALFTASCILNCGWIVLWTNRQIAWSQVFLYGVTGSLFYLWYINGPASRVTQNCLAIYVAWTLGASILNTCITLKQSTKLSDTTLSQGALLAFCVAQLGWQYLFADRIDESLPVAFVGLWTCVGIVQRNEPDAGIWRLGLATTVVASVLSVASIWPSPK